jgi:hypothetical protein
MDGKGGQNQRLFRPKDETYHRLATRAGSFFIQNTTLSVLPTSGVSGTSKWDWHAKFTP